MNTVFAAPPPPTLPVAGEQAVFPVHRIYCVGHNYAAHVHEMGGSERDRPVFFSKPPDAVDISGRIPYPPATHDFHHEVELVAALGAGGSNIAPQTAQDAVYGYAVGLDLTRRDLQRAAKEAGNPWDMAKGFDHAAPCTPLQRAAAIGHPRRGSIDLWVGDAHRQHADLAAMIWSVPEIIAELSRLVQLQAGDLIFTGTPQGVGPLQVGDQVRAAIEGVGELQIQIVAA